MERINGITLEKYLKTSNKTLTDKELQVIALKIRLLHSLNISHNDLHIENILCTVDDQLKITNLYIIDFGFSTFLNEKYIPIYDFDHDFNTNDKDYETFIESYSFYANFYITN